MLDLTLAYSERNKIPDLTLILGSNKYIPNQNNLFISDDYYLMQTESTSSLLVPWLTPIQLLSLSLDETFWDIFSDTSSLDLTLLCAPYLA